MLRSIYSKTPRFGPSLFFSGAEFFPGKNSKLSSNSRLLSSRIFKQKKLDGKSYPSPRDTRNFQNLSRFFSTAVANETINDAEVSEISPVTCRRSGVRNVAIIAHVDHGKTTLVDQLLQACSSDQKNEERLLDCGELEKERGITINSKVTRCDYRETIVNIVDTPGHADFCGEVDRILSLVDGVCLVVDAAEGPMAQTKYVLSRALSLGLKPIVVLNKVDRDDGLSRVESGETESQLLDLFDELGATDEQMDYTTIYASARNGKSIFIVFVVVLTLYSSGVAYSNIYFLPPRLVHKGSRGSFFFGPEDRSTAT